MKFVVPLFVIVPLFESVPPIFKIPATLMVKVAPGAIVRLPHVTLPFMAGILVAPAGIVTSVDEVGKMPEHQLLAFAQSVLTLPVHCPGVVVERTLT